MEQNKVGLIQTDTAIVQPSAGVDAKQFLNMQNDNTSGRFYCDALFDHSINGVIGSVIPHLITLIGFSEFGKSTFVASVYHELMTNGCIGEYQFVDSDTYAGFERRAHVRNAKINPEKRLSRTTHLEGYFLSMVFTRNNEDKKLIISDRSGETYLKVYTSDLSAVKQDIALINSPHIIFFIDTSVLMNDADFLSFKDSFGMLLSRMHQAEVFVNNKILDIIFNKTDQLITDELKSTFEENAKSIKQMIAEHGVLNKEFCIVSNRMIANEDLKGVLEYMVSSCDIFKEDIIEDVDWVHHF